MNTLHVGPDSLVIAFNTAYLRWEDILLVLILSALYTNEQIAQDSGHLLHSTHSFPTPGTSTLSPVFSLHLGKTCFYYLDFSSL